MLLMMMVLTDDQSDLIEQLYKEHYGLFYSIAYNILKSKQAAEDAVHTSFAKISEKIDRISQIPCPQMRAYCIVIVEHDALAMIRADKKTDLTASPDEEVASKDMPPEEQVIQNEMTETVRGCITMLPEEDRKLVIMRYYKDFSYRQIADHFGISEDAAKKRGQRVLKRMQRLLTGEALGDE